MAYNKELDKEIFSKNADLDNGFLTVSVFSYNEGTPKLQISRKLYDPDMNPKWAKLGRMTKDEVEKVMPLIKEALENM